MPPEGYTNIPKALLIDILNDIRLRVEIGDSYEGFLNYLLPTDDDAEPETFDVDCRYRIGNLEGQGGMRILGG